MKNIVFASNNKNKIKEVKEILSSYNVLSLNDIGFYDDIVEDGQTFEDNALIKVRATKQFIDKHNIKATIIADDSGLCVPSLNNEPGVYSARYAGDHNDQNNRNKLLQNLKDKKDRSAYFVCAMALMEEDGKEHTFFGKVDGTILKEEQGSKVFGYDCLFYCNEISKCFGDAKPEEKNAVSHRGRALKQVKEFLTK